MLALVLPPIVALTAPPPAPTCSLPQTSPTAQQAPSPRARKLGELPDAEMDLAVIRMVDGCAVRQVVGFNVSDRSGRAPSGVGAHVPGFTGTLVPEGPAGAKTRPIR